MSSRSTTYIRDRRSGELMEATLIDGVSKEEIEATEQTWRPMFKTAPPNSSRQHAHWDWKKRVFADYSGSFSALRGNG